MIRKLKGPDHIADHIEKRGYRHNYVLYYTGADYYDGEIGKWYETIPYCELPVSVKKRFAIKNHIYNL